MRRCICMISIFLLAFVSGYSHAANRVIPSIIFLLNDEPVEDDVVCPSFISVVTGNQGAFPNSSRETGIISLGFLNITNTDAPFSGVLEWRVEGLDNSVISLNPASNSVAFDAEGSNTPSVFSRSIITASAGAISGTDIPVVLSYTLITNDVNGNECNRQEFSGNLIYSVI